LAFDESMKFKHTNGVRNQNGMITEVTKKVAQALSPASRARMEEHKASEHANLQKMIEKRLSKREQLLTNPLKKLKTIEKSKLNQGGIEGFGNLAGRKEKEMADDEDCGLEIIGEDEGSKGRSLKEMFSLGRKQKARDMSVTETSKDPENKPKMRSLQDMIKKRQQKN
jgi:hypothetical protein